jgi:hypothetical protein
VNCTAPAPDGEREHYDGRRQTNVVTCRDCLSAEPVLAADGGSVSFRVGGRGLIVRVSDGVLTATE